MARPTATMVAAGPAYSRRQLTALTALRMLIGWHFLYEGLVKLLNPYWTAAGYLAESRWIFSGIFRSIAGNPTSLTLADTLIRWGLVVIGACLILGLFSRSSTAAGILLVSLFYLAAPPLRGYTYSMPAEGSYLVVNKTLIEMVALCVLYVLPTGAISGLDGLIFRQRDATYLPVVPVENNR